MSNDNGPRRHEIPRTFREVGIIMAEIIDDIQDVKKTQDKIIARMDRFVNIMVVSILCPIIVSVVIGFFIKSAK